VGQRKVKCAKAPMLRMEIGVGVAMTIPNVN
jgi:hypothetical protein